MKKIGTVSVDSGQLLIVDPCYISELTEEHYEECCDATCEEGNPFKNYDQVFNKLGICSSSGWGDGEYNVYVEEREGRVMKIVIDFEEEVD